MGELLRIVSTFGAKNKRYVFLLSGRLSYSSIQHNFYFERSEKNCVLPAQRVLELAVFLRRF